MTTRPNNMKTKVPWEAKGTDEKLSVLRADLTGASAELLRLLPATSEYRLEVRGAVSFALLITRVKE